MRIMRIVLVGCLLGAIAACGKQAEFASVGNKLRNVSSAPTDVHGREETKKAERFSATDGDAMDGKAKDMAPPGEILGGLRAPAKEAPAKEAPAKEAPVAAPPKAAVADPVVGRAAAKPKMPKEPAPPSGILTAGSFDDNLEPLIFSSYVRRISQRQGLGDLIGKMSGQRLLILVRDGSGKPVGNARVRLSAGAGSPVELTTRSDGRAVFHLAFDQLPADLPLQASVTGPDSGAAVTDTIATGSPRWEITLPGVQAQLPKNLDLAIILDTTGSMGDELKYLQSEIRGISAAIAKQFPEVKQRFALVLYRDEGDEYVVRQFDFTESLDLFHKRLRQQSAGGGGDYPEAMHKGIEEANQLRWLDKDAARVAFLIGDAPPHAQHMNRTLAAVDALRKKGVALYPVACSGYDDACEFVMRSTAMLTGSQFLFLTNDSGVGNSHAEPTIPYYQVEHLERLMTRMITGELSGRRVEALPTDIIRTVGTRPGNK